MGRTNGLLTATGAIALLAMMAGPGVAAVGQPGLRPAVANADLIQVAAKRKHSAQAQGQQIDKKLAKSGYKQQIQQYMGQDSYQQMIGGGIPGH